MRDHDLKTSKMSKQSNEEDCIWIWYTFTHQAWFQGNITNTTTNNTDNITTNCCLVYGLRSSVIYENVIFNEHYFELPRVNDNSHECHHVESTLYFMQPFFRAHMLWLSCLSHVGIHPLNTQRTHSHGLSCFNSHRNYQREPVRQMST